MPVLGSRVCLHLSWVLRGLCTCVSEGLCVMLVLRVVCLGYVEGSAPSLASEGCVCPCWF